MIEKHTHYFKNPLKQPYSVTLYAGLSGAHIGLWEAFKVLFFSKRETVYDINCTTWYQIVWLEKEHILYILNIVTDEEIQGISRR